MTKLRDATDEELFEGDTFHTTGGGGVWIFVDRWSGAVTIDESLPLEDFKWLVERLKGVRFENGEVG